MKDAFFALMCSYRRIAETQSQPMGTEHPTITLQTKFIRRTVEPPWHLTSPEKSFGQSRFATGAVVSVHHEEDPLQSILRFTASQNIFPL